MLKGLRRFACGLTLAALQVVFMPNSTVQASIFTEDALLARGYAHKDEYKLLIAMEPDALAATQKATRNGDLLILRSVGGEKAFQDCTESETNCKFVLYRLLLHAASRNTFIVAKFGMETVEYYLINDVTGRQNIFYTLPIFSPENRHILVLPDEEAEGAVLQIWRRAEDQFHLEWSSPHYPGKYSSYSVIGWPSECCIELRSQSEFSSDSQSAVSKRISLHKLIRDKSGWKAIDPENPTK